MYLHRQGILQKNSLFCNHKRQKKILLRRQRWFFSLECLKKIMMLAMFCCENVLVTIANKPMAKHGLKGEAKNSCVRFCRTVRCELA